MIKVLRIFSFALALGGLLELSMIVNALNTQNEHLSRMVYYTTQASQSDPLSFRQISEGHYQVVEVMDRHNGTALLRNDLHTGGVSIVVTGIPERLLADGTRFSTWENWRHGSEPRI